MPSAPATRSRPLAAKTPPVKPSEPVLMDQLLRALIVLEQDLVEARDSGKISKRECGVMRSLVLALHDRLEDASRAPRP